MLRLMGRFITVALIIFAVSSTLHGWILWVYSAWNLIAALYYAYDKLIARQNAGKRRQAARVSESRLLWMAVLLGAGGALISMLLFWHKVRKWPFFLTVPLLLTVQIALLWWLGGRLPAP